MINSPDFAGIWSKFQAAYEQEKFAEALALLQSLPQPQAREFQVIAYQADLLGKLGDPEREILLLRQLAEEYPQIASLWDSIATAQKALGRPEEALSSWRRAIAIGPNYGKPWWQLSQLKGFRFEDDEVATLEHMLDGELRTEDSLHVHFALGKELETRGDFESAFRHYAIANAQRAETLEPRSMSVTTRVDRTIDLFTADFMKQRAGRGTPSTAPIFIVGLHRSGSTLIEQILSSHPAIEGLSELPILPQITREIALDARFGPGNLIDRLGAFTPSDWRAIGQTYLDRAAAFRRTDRPMFIDKMPGNWINIGLIRLALPDAKIIDARRHPLATGVSNFKQNFGIGANYIYDLGAIGRYYRDYLRLVSHFERIEAAAVHRVINERLIEDFETSVRELLACVGVPFDPACLDFHVNARSVRTPSAEQVRRPINRDGVDQWRAFEPWLDPLKDALGPALAGWDLPPGSYIDGNPKGPDQHVR